MKYLLTDRTTGNVLLEFAEVKTNPFLSNYMRLTGCNVIPIPQSIKQQDILLVSPSEGLTVEVLEIEIVDNETIGIDTGQIISKPPF